MCPVTLAALLGLAASGCLPEGPSALLAPADPALTSRWTPPPSPTAGLKKLVPVRPKDWLRPNEAPAAETMPMNHGPMPMDHGATKMDMSGHEGMKH